MATSQQTEAALPGGMANSEGTGRDDAGGIQVENPATGQVIRTVPVVGPEQVKAMVDRARVAQVGWQALGFEGRARVLRRAQKWVTENSERLAETIISETGKTVEDAQLAEIAYALAA